MTAKMTLLYVADVGQVVAGVTRSASPAEDLPVSSLADETFVYRGGVTPFGIPAEDLDVATVDFDAAVLLAPGRYQLVDDVPTVPPPPALASVMIASTNSDISVTVTVPPIDLPTAPTKPVQVWIHLQGATSGEQASLRTEIPLGSPTVAASSAPAPVALDPGTYDTLWAIEGYGLFSGQVVIPGP